jgi:ABC-type transporter Mla subunit MlaD
MAGLMFVGWSPLWLFAAAADLTSGTRTYLQALVFELRRDGLLPEGADIASVEELLNSLEGTSGLVAESLDAPPLNINAMRASWRALRRQVTDLPDAERLADLYADLQQVSKREGRSLRSVSSLIAAGALRAGVRMDQVHIFDYYENALHTIARAGLAVYARRVTRPYLAVARGHFDPARQTHTERLLQRLGHQPGVMPAKGQGRGTGE